MVAQKTVLEGADAPFIQDLPDPYTATVDLPGYVNDAAYNDTVSWDEVKRQNAA